MSNDFNPENQAGEAPSQRVSFFRDSSKPLGLRIGVFAALLVVVTFPIWGQSDESGESATSFSRTIDDSAFPSGSAGLADSNAEADGIRAMTQGYRRETGGRTAAAEEASEAATLKAQDLEDEYYSGEQDEGVSAEEAELAQEDDSPSGLGPFRQVLNDIEHPVQLHYDRSGTLWVAHLWGVVSLRGENYSERRDVLNKRIYDADFNDDLPAITALGSDDEGSIWIGLGNGQVMRYRRYDWQIVSPPGDTIRAGITSIQPFQKGVHFASMGVFKWDTQFERMLVNPKFRSERIYQFVYGQDGAAFYMGGNSGLWRFDEEQRDWVNIWKPQRKDYAVYTILPDEDDSFLLGTGNGVVRVSNVGIVQDRALQGTHITTLLRDGEDGLWAGTRRNGLKYFDGEDWYAVSAEQGLKEHIAFLHLDSKQQLWLGVDQKGILVAPVSKARSWLMKYKDASIPEAGPKVYGSLCDAADEVLKDIKVSGDITVDNFDGQRLVFVAGQQACPAGLGYRGLDGSALLLRGWNAIIHKETGRREISLPQQLPADQAKVVLLDSKERIWLGTEAAGLFVIEDEEQWRAVDSTQFYGNAVTSIIEDPAGRIWVGTVPQVDKANNRFSHANLHLYSDGSWYHFDPRNGLAQISTHSLYLRPDGVLLVGTHGGFSEITKDGEVTSYTQRHGLDPYFINSVSVDRKKRVWMAHQYFGDGITWLDGDSFYRVDETNGLFNNRINSIAHDRAKRVWVIASNGRVGIYPLSDLQGMAKKTPLDKRRVRSRPLIR